MSDLSKMLGQRWQGILLVVMIVTAIIAGLNIRPIWKVEGWVVSTFMDESGKQVIQAAGRTVVPEEAVSADRSLLLPLRGKKLTEKPSRDSEIVLSNEGNFVELRVVSHYGWWSLWPALTAVVLCFMLREPVVALAGGVVAGAAVTANYDAIGAFLIPAIGSPNGATILILYLWFLGGLLGVWTRTGAAASFAEWVTKRFVRGPRGAKFVAWLLGVIFFQGGTLSTVLVGTTVRPVADKQRVSHEELSYVVDSTASPIAVLLPFNAWPIYVSSFIFVAGVPFLVTPAERISFFFTCIPLYFYAWLAVLFTLLLCFDKLPFIGKSFREAIHRSRESGLLDRPGAAPLSTEHFKTSDVAPGYRPSALEFAVPLLLLIGTAVSTFFVTGRPQVLWAFGGALCVASIWSLLRGLKLRVLMDGISHGMGGVVYGSVVLLLAITVGHTSRETGAGVFLVELLGDKMPHILLPLALVFVTMVIAFSTGTSFGTFAVTLPLGMPLAWAVGTSAGLQNPELYLCICFATMICGSVFGDHCSPISDTTVLSSLTTGCDLIDHVRTQIVPCFVAMGLSLVLWVALLLTV